MTDYSNGKIYKIICDETEKIYIGSTVQSLTKRFQKHKSHHISWKNGKYNYISIFKMFDEYGKQNCNIELIENYPCDNKKVLELREAYFIRNNNCYNKYIPGRTLKEYYEVNKKKIKEDQKKYYENNKEKYKDTKKKYYEDNKEVRKKYYEYNKERINEKHNCECGGKYTSHHKATHLKTKKHEAYEKEKQQQQIININITNLTINN